MRKIVDIEHTSVPGRIAKRVTFRLDGIDCEMVRYVWDGPVHAFADRDRDGVREPVKLQSADVRLAFETAWTYETDVALAAAMARAHRVMAEAALA